MREYRVTLPERYPETSSGHTNITAREGYYVTAADSHDAAVQIRQRLDVKDRRFDVQPWPPYFDQLERVVLRARR